MNTATKPDTGVNNCTVLTNLNGITALVTPEDKERILLYATRHRVSSAVVAGVLADMGETAINEHKLSRWIPDKSLSSSLRLWRVINRDASDFSERIELVMAFNTRSSHEADASHMGRGMDDWMGTLIHEGLQAIRDGASFSKFMLRCDPESLLFTACAWLTGDLRKEPLGIFPGRITTEYAYSDKIGEQSNPQVRVRINIPESMLNVFNSSWDRLDPEAGRERFSFAIEMLVSNPVNGRDPRPFNKPMGRSSPKRLLREAKSLLKIGRHKNVEAVITESTWFLIKELASFYKISTSDCVLIAFYYYVDLENREQAKKSKPSVPAPFKNFERTLSKESKAAKEAAKQGVES